MQDVTPPTLRSWIAQFLDDVLDVNARLPRTLVSLVRSPGLLTSEWLAGRRARYLPPVRLYVLCSVAMFATGIALRLIGEHFGVGYRPKGAVADDAYAEVARQSATHALFVLVPLSAVWLKLFFRRANRVYVEHLVFTLHVHAFGFVAAVAMYLMVFAPAPLKPWLQSSFQLSALVYLVLAMRRVYGQPMLRTVAKGVVLFAMHGAAVAALTFALIDLRYDPAPERQAQVAPVHAGE
ncbi:MAG TPA: DUF3667 domain-containing protein [Longimicrobiaceae bacterium]|nr:DUF3667 domain-containing protein [Longimicrobiaceae bacterium]